MPLGSAIRRSLTDFYFNSWRLAPANVLWGVALVALVIATSAFPPTVVLLPLLAIPLAGIHRMTALIARDEPVSFADFLDGCRRFGLPAAALAAAAAVCALVLATNVLLGFQSSNALTWFISASAGYGLFGLAMFLVAAWPILVDPWHGHLPVRRRVLLAGLVLIGRPVRLMALTLGVTVILVVSTVLLALVALVAVAFAALIASHVVLPTVDELETPLPAAPPMR